MAQKDFLSGLANRRYFFQLMQSYMDESKVHHEPFAVGLIDIDHFKQINDTFGHEAGDSVIVMLSEQLKKQQWPDMFIARFGGDEFCVVLKKCDPKKALEYFIKLTDTISHIPVPLKDVNPLHVSISIGVTFNDVGSLKEIIKQADEALYKAKKNGRNRVEVI